MSSRLLARPAADSRGFSISQAFRVLRRCFCQTKERASVLGSRVCLRVSCNLFPKAPFVYLENDTEGTVSDEGKGNFLLCRCRRYFRERSILLPSASEPTLTPSTRRETSLSDTKVPPKTDEMHNHLGVKSTAGGVARRLASSARRVLLYRLQGCRFDSDCGSSKFLDRNRWWGDVFETVGSQKYNLVLHSRHISAREDIF